MKVRIIALPRQPRKSKIRFNSQMGECREWGACRTEKKGVRSNSSKKKKRRQATRRNGEESQNAAPFQGEGQKHESLAEFWRDTKGEYVSGGKMRKGGRLGRKRLRCGEKKVAETWKKKKGGCVRRQS